MRFKTCAFDFLTQWLGLNRETRLGRVVDPHYRQIILLRKTEQLLKGESLSDKYRAHSQRLNGDQHQAHADKVLKIELRFYTGHVYHA